MPNNTLLPMEMDALFQRITAERTRQQAMRNAWQANAARIADVIGARWQIAPWVPADVIAITALYGLDDEAFGSIAETAGQAGMAKGGLVEQAQIAGLNNPFGLQGLLASRTPEQQAETQAQVDAMRANREIGVQAQESGGGMWRFVLENPVTRAGGRIMETGGGAIPDVVRRGVKGTVRTGIGAVMFPYEVVQNVAAGGAHQVGDVVGPLSRGEFGDSWNAFIGRGDSEYSSGLSDPGIDFGIVQATSAGQAVSQLAETGSIDAGSGFFVGGTVHEQQAQRARDVRGTVDGQAWTIGRAAASTVFEPGSSPYGWVSGTIDAASAVGLDPANYVGAGIAKARRAARVTAPTAAEATTLAQASRLAAAGDEAGAQALLGRVADLSGVSRAARRADPEWRAAVEEAAGMIPAGSLGVRRAVLAPRAMKWVLSTDGRKVVQAFREETSATRTWLAMGRKVGPADAQALAKATTDADVIRILGDGFSGGRIRRLPTPGHWPGSNLPGMSITTRAADRWRFAGRFPETTFLDPDDDVRAMNTLYDTLGNSGIKGDKRLALTDGWIKAKATGLKGDEYKAIKATWTAIDKKLVDAGVPKELARAITDGRRAYGRETDWLTDDFADGISADFLGLDAGGGPSMLVEALSSGMWLMDPTQLRAVRSQTSRLGRIIAGNKSLSVPKALAEFYTQDLWKPSVLVRPAYITRVGGDEVARTLMGGEFRHVTDFMLAMVGHGYGDNLFSNVIRKVGGRYGTDLSGDPTNLGKFLNKLDDDIDAAQAADNTDEVSRLIAKRTEVADRMADGFEGDYKRAMIGQSRAKSVGTMLRDDYVAEYQMRTGNILRRSKLDPSHTDQWVDGLGWELGKIHADRVARRVANGGLLKSDLPKGSLAGEPAEGSVRVYRGGVPGTHRVPEEYPRGLYYTTDRAKAEGEYLVTGGPRGERGRSLLHVDVPESVWDEARTLGGTVEAGGRGWRADEGVLPVEWAEQARAVTPAKFRPGIDGIEDWVVANGDGVRDELAAMYPGVDWADPANARKWVDHQLAIVDHFAGMNGEIRQMVATGRLGDKGAFFPFAGRMETAPHVYDHLRTWHEAADSPEWVRWNQTLTGTGESFEGALVRRGKDLRDEILGKFFGSLYGKTSDYLARNPTFNRFLWKHYDEMAGLLTKDDAAKVLAKIDNAKLPKDMDARIKANLRAADGTESLEDIDKLAKGYALDDTQALLFDVSKRSQFFDMAKILFPFGEAWKEFLVTWTRAGYQRPEIVNSLRKTIVSGREGDPDQNGQGFLYRNAYGDEVFNYPLVGRMAELATGVNVGFEGSLLGLSMGTQIMPGIGPVAAVPLAQLVPDSPTFNTVAELLFPYGTPEERGDYLNALPIPGWAQKLGVAIPGLNEAFGLDDPKKNLTYGNTYFEVSAALAASGDYDLTNPQERDRLDRDARSKAKIITAMRGMVQATGPTSPGLVYKVATLEGDVTVPMLAEDLREMQEEDYDTAVARFLEKYGEGVFVYLASKSYLVNPGVTPTDEFGKWEAEHGQLIERYPRVGAYFGPEGVEFSIDVYNQQVRSGSRSRRDSPNDRIAEAQDIVARSIYFEAKAKIGPDPTPEQEAWLGQVKADLQDDYPGFVLTGESQVKLTEQIAELDRAADDIDVQALPAGQALKIYMDLRDDVLDAQVDQGVSKSSTSITKAKGGRHLRDHLRAAAADLIEDHPEFERVWRDVLAKELPEEAIDAAA